MRIIAYTKKNGKALYDNIFIYLCGDKRHSGKHEQALLPLVCIIIVNNITIWTFIYYILYIL